MDGDDVKAVRTQFTGPTASLADPLEQALLVSVADRAITATGVQKVSLKANRSKVRRTKAQRSEWVGMYHIHRIKNMSKAE